MLIIIICAIGLVWWYLFSSVCRLGSIWVPFFFLLFGSQFYTHKIYIYISDHSLFAPKTKRFLFCHIPSLLSLVCVHLLFFFLLQIYYFDSLSFLSMVVLWLNNSWAKNPHLSMLWCHFTLCYICVAFHLPCAEIRLKWRYEEQYEATECNHNTGKQEARSIWLWYIKEKANDWWSWWERNWNEN